MGKYKYKVRLKHGCFDTVEFLEAVHVTILPFLKARGTGLDNDFSFELDGEDAVALKLTLPSIVEMSKHEEGL